MSITSDKFVWYDSSKASPVYAEERKNWVDLVCKDLDDGDKTEWSYVRSGDSIVFGVKTKNDRLVQVFECKVLKVGEMTLPQQEQNNSPSIDGD